LPPLPFCPTLLQHFFPSCKRLHIGNVTNLLIDPSIQVLQFIRHMVYHVITQLLIQLLHLQICNRYLDCSLLTFIVICMESKFFLFFDVVLQRVIRLEELDESITDLLVNEVLIKLWRRLLLFLDLLGGLSNLWLLFLFLAEYGAQEPKKTFGFLLYCLNVLDNSINFMGNVSNNLAPFFVHLASVFAELESARSKGDKGERINFYTFSMIAVDVSLSILILPKQQMFQSSPSCSLNDGTLI